MSLFTFRPPDDPAQMPAPERGAGTLRVECSRPEVRRKLSECLTRAGAEHETKGAAFEVRTDNLDGLALELSGALSADEQAAARASFTRRGRGRAAHAHCLHCLLREAQGRWVFGLLRPGGLTAVFQPIVRCGRSEVFGFEALMRVGGGQGAAPFDAARVLAAARASGLCLQLDRHACRTALSEASRHRVSTKLFLNVTPGSLYRAGHGVEEAVEALEALRLSPHQIVFEVVESEPVSDWKLLREALGRYRERGFQVALDDFGSAYSSPVTLCELRPDYVKLDRALIRNVHADPCRAAVTAKLIEAARAFGAKIIAEGVETAGEYGWVAGREVEYAQGFYISRPAAPPPFVYAA